MLGEKKKNYDIDIMIVIAALGEEHLLDYLALLEVKKHSVDINSQAVALLGTAHILSRYHLQASPSACTKRTIHLCSRY